MMEEIVEEGLSIGALSRATGISIHSLRMWERRYGSPASLRRASGHRRYPVEEVDRLRAVARALAAGFRASEVVTADIEKIDELMSVGRSATGRPRQTKGLEGNLTILERMDDWVDATRRFDDVKLIRDFQEDWTKLGVLRFLLDRAVPFLMKLGDNWQSGQLSIAHEHFATERLTDFLVTKWRPVNDLTTGRPFVMATLLQDLHSLGLQLASTLVVFAEFHIIFLSSQVPTEEIIETALQCNARGVGISISRSIPNRFATTSLQSIRKELPATTSVVCGGSGAPTGIDGVTSFSDLLSFHQWLTDQKGTIGAAR